MAKYGSGFKRPTDFFTGKPFGNPMLYVGRYTPGGGAGSPGRVELMPENTPNPQDKPHDAKVTDNAE